MSDEFKKQLQLYEDGELQGEELTEFENELAKLEQYQNNLEQDETEHTQPHINEKQQKGILNRSKWKARIQTAFTALGILIILLIVSATLTGIYFSIGKTNRMDVFRNVVDQTLTVTNPYGDMGRSSTSSGAFFNLTLTRDMDKTVGHEQISVSELEIPFFFSFMMVPKINNYYNTKQNSPPFIYPEPEVVAYPEWNQLENLPEGTVVSAYVSFNELLDTGDVFNIFLERDLDISWFAVDAGEQDLRDHGIVFDPIGFPASPIWHEDDMIQDYSEEEKGGWFSGTTSTGSTSPEYEVGNTEMLHTQFLKTLMFLQGHEGKFNKLYRGHKLELQEQIDYLEKNGINHYGIVITGPTKEVLKLKEVEEISALEIDEVEFWNWDN